VVRGKARRKIDLALSQRGRNFARGRQFDKADIGEAFGAQQLLGGVERCDADGRSLQNPHGGGFKGSLRRLRPWSVDQARGAGGRYAAQKAASGLDQCHCKSPCARLGLQLAF